MEANVPLGRDDLFRHRAQRRDAAGWEARPIPLIVVRFRVDRAIAGVRPGQVLTVREWAGAWSMHRAMREGQRLLIFLYPASRLGLTSPVGGPQGQVVLGSRGSIVRTSEVGIDSSAFAARLKSCPPANLTGVGVFPGYGDFAQGQCGSENSVVPGRGCADEMGRSRRNARRSTHGAGAQHGRAAEQCPH